MRLRRLSRQFHLPDVDCVVVNRDGGESLFAALRSLEKQVGIDLSIVIVDNGSSSLERERLAREAPAVHVLPFPRNLGFAGAANEGIARTRAPFVLLVNNDAVLAPDYVARLAARLALDRRLAGAQGLVLNADGSRVDSAGLEWNGRGEAVPIFAGASWLPLDDRVWSATSYLPGRTLDGESRLDLEAAGAFLAEYHQVAWTIAMGGQRPTAAPLEQLAELALWDRIADALGDASDARQLRRWTDELMQELEALAYGALARIVVHGDATLPNMVLDGEPPRLVGLIDFGSAYYDAWLTDLSAGLWRSGRLVQEAIGLDPERVARFVAGYHSRRPVDPAQARAIPTLIKARGLQLIVRRTRRATSGARQDVLAAFTRTGWLREHQPMLEDAILAALSP